MRTASLLQDVQLLVSILQIIMCPIFADELAPTQRTYIRSVDRRLLYMAVRPLQRNVLILVYYVAIELRYVM